ncbi:coenzyme F420-0:L-glutamate ligase [Methanopyrus sp. SNP6]|uniref:coenzyme F420-0:L-glutamate ligase n=1 Tax=Methanopyrus sp. SNP6 TaxID=1937005 RepID=UPI0011E5DCF8|nr:coenzyme F420-0:L-glutamate ligase [Methanopyrus sp. SNP6]
MSDAQYRLIPVKSRYWKVGSGTVGNALEALRGIELKDGDVLLLSEKAVAVAEGELIDERGYEPGVLARFLVVLWMRIFWGRILGPLLGPLMDPPMRTETIENLRNYPLKDGSRHKQMILEEFGLLHALEPASEAGCDVGNVPGYYAAPVPKSADRVARELREELRRRRDVDVSVVVGDTDKTYEILGILFTTVARAHPDIVAGTGVIGFLVGRLLAKTVGPTPIAIAGNVSVREAIKLLDMAEDVRTKGAGRTVYDALEEVGDPESLDEEFLNGFDHVPIVIARPITP